VLPTLSFALNIAGVFGGNAIFGGGGGQYGKRPPLFSVLTGIMQRQSRKAVILKSGWLDTRSSRILTSIHLMLFADQMQMSNSGYTSARNSCRNLGAMGES